LSLPGEGVCLGGAQKKEGEMSKDVRVHLTPVQLARIEKARAEEETPPDEEASPDPMDSGSSAELGDDTLRGSGGRLTDARKSRDLR
jgi:hypothetical protein